MNIYCVCVGVFCPQERPRPDHGPLIGADHVAFKPAMFKAWSFKNVEEDGTYIQ